MASRFATALFGLALLAGIAEATRPSFAGERSVTLKVSMWCASCPYIIKRSLEDVAGVVAVEVSFRQQTAIVRFDDGRTSIPALTQATAGVGFPSQAQTSN